MMRQVINLSVRMIARQRPVSVRAHDVFSQPKEMYVDKVGAMEVERVHINHKPSVRAKRSRNHLRWQKSAANFHQRGFGGCKTTTVGYTAMGNAILASMPTIRKGRISSSVSP
jgi:hypothetical protein